MSSCRLSLTLTAACFAQQGPDSSLKIPTLNGHRFVPTATVADPFLNSYLRTSAGVGTTGRVTLPGIDIGEDTVITAAGELAIANLSLVYQQRVKEWLSFRANFSLAGRLGTDAASLVAAGLDAGTNMQLGWLVQAFRLRTTLLSVYLGASRATTTLVQPAKFLDDALRGQSATLSDNIPSIQAIGSLRLAHGFSKLLGVKFVGTILYGEQTFSRDSELDLNWKAGGSISIDPRDVIQIPVGFLVSYTFSTVSPGIREPGTKTQEFELKIDYTAPSDYQFGISLSVTRSPSSIVNSITLASLQINSRFYL